MGLGRIITICVAICVFTLLWFFIGVLILPHLQNTIGLPSLAPSPFWQAIYVVLAKICEYATIIILVVFCMLWLIDCIIRATIPGFFLSMIGWEFSPFSDLRAAGIFGLFDAILSPFIGFNSGTPPTTMPEAVVNFIEKGSIFLANQVDLGDDPGVQKANANQAKKNDAKNKKDETYEASPLSDDVQFEIDERFQQCLEENLLNVTKGMSAAEIYSVNAQNQTAQVKCKLDQMKQSMDTISKRI